MVKQTGKLGSQEIEVDLVPRAKRFPTMNPLGYTIADPRPVAPPIGYKKPVSMIEEMRALIRSEMAARAASSAGFETFEESEDFDVEDPYGIVDPSSPWENDFDPPAREIAEAVGDARARPPAPPAAPSAGVSGAEPPTAGPAAEPPPAKPA